MEDSAILDLFFARSEQAIAEVDRKYGAMSRKLAANLLGSEHDAEECVDDAYLALWQKIPPERPNPLRAYLLRIVRNRALTRRRDDHAAKRSNRIDASLDELAGVLSAPGGVEEAFDAKELAASISAFLAQQKPENRVIFMRRFWYADSYADIAHRMGMTQKNVSVRLTRIKKELRGWLAEREVLV